MGRPGLWQPLFRAAPDRSVFPFGGGESGEKEGRLVKKAESWGGTEKKLWKAQGENFKKGIAGEENFL